jgi:trehalose-phosphatase
MPKSSVWTSFLAEIDLSWKQDVLQIFEYYTERTPGSFIEYKQSSLTWHYRLADPVYGSWQAKECQIHLEKMFLSKMPLEVLTSKKNLEVRPISINKGEMVKRILVLYPNVDFILCVGDDRTDEDMFRAIRTTVPIEISYFTCILGEKSSQAQYCMKDSDELVNFITLMAEH